MQIGNPYKDQLCTCPKESSAKYHRCQLYRDTLTRPLITEVYYQVSNYTIK